MSAIADVGRFNRSVCHAAPLARRTPGVALIQALADYPALQLWKELSELLPPDAAARAYEAAERLYRDTRA